MALIAVICVVGVVSAEVLGPVANVRRLWARGSDDGGGVKQAAVRAELADDTFQFPPDAPSLFELLLAPPPRGKKSALPDLAFSAIEMSLRGDSGGDDEISLISIQASPQELAVSGDLADVDFTYSHSPEPFSFFSPQQPLIFTTLAAEPGPTGAPPTPGAPEPSAWLLLILGIGGAGMALRRRRGQASGLPEGCVSEHLQS